MATLQKITELVSSHTESAAVSSISKSMKKLRELKKSDDSQSIRKEFHNIIQCYFHFKTYLPSIIIELKRQKYVPLVSSYINQFSKLGYFSSNDVWYATIDAFSGLLNYTDACQDFGNEILQTTLPKVLLSNVLHQPYVENLPEKNEKIINFSISIIHNIVRYPGNCGVFRTEKLKKFLVSLIRNHNKDNIGITSMLTLSYLVDENEIHLLEEGKNTIKYLVQLINQAFEQEDKTTEGFSLWEFLNGLKSVAVNDNMKKSIIEESGIEIILQILNSPSSDNDSEKCLGILWNLCFDKEIKNQLLSDYHLREVIKPFETHKSKEIKKCIDGIIWLINGATQFKTEMKTCRKAESNLSKEKWKFDVFLSYGWTVKDTIIPVLDQLKKTNVKVWFDKDQMKGSTLEAMADGIENSHVFLMAISDAYISSQNCRAEAQYAFKLKKPIIPLKMESNIRPPGWLQMIMGSQIYYDFSGRRNFLETFNRLLNDLKSKRYNGSESNDDTFQPDIKNDFVDSVKSNVTMSNGNSKVCSWSKEDVRNWLNKYELGHFRDKFSAVDGKFLISFIDIHSKYPDYILKALKNEFGMKLIDVVKMNLAIKELQL